MEQGEIWLLEEPDRAPRPSLVLTRPAAIDRLTSVMVSPLTRTIRGLPTEVHLDERDGVRIECVASFDNVATVWKGHLTRHLATLPAARWPEVCAAMRTAIGC